ncbi:RHS repeat-associated core domain-containing protein [Microbulbifer elongatus]|uniref:RHS repeat-associated core domain-containing protein n=2 Tax=Microbulbifer elongatus TaxID=86173 RepID=UPI0030B9FACF
MTSELEGFDSSLTTRGYTGHEMLDQVGLIHMNGRIYDARLGRFLQADPILQFPDNAQSYNRYSYVLNNPLTYTDPSGHIIPAIVGIVMAVAKVKVAYIAVTVGVLTFAQAMVQGADFGDALIAGVSAAAMSYVGGTIAQGSGFGANLETLGFSTLGGITSALQGGKFGHGFVSAGVGAVTGGSLKLESGAGWANLGKAAARVAIAGTVSRATGGKFANGASTAAFAMLLSAAAQSRQKIPGFDLSTSEGREQYANWVWENKGMFGIEAADGTSFEYVDEYMMYDNTFGRVICDGPCTQVDNVSRFEMGGEFFQDSGKIVLYRGAFTPMEAAVIMGPDSNPTILGNLNTSPAGSVVWAMGHEAAHTLGVDIGSAVYPHLGAENYGYKAYQKYRALGGK